MKSLAFVLGSLLCLNTLVSAQLRGPVEQFVAAHQQHIVRELVELLSIPNVAADRDNVRRNATLLRDLLARRGFTVEILETDGNPLVFAELLVPGAQRTLLFYAHYDGQPVDPKGWSQPSPFTPVLRRARLEDGGQEIPNFLALRQFPPEARLYARSASDDKAPIIARLTAVDALASMNQRPTSNVKVILPEDLMRFFGIGRTEQVGANLQEALQYPSLNIRGLHSGDIGDQARTIIPDRATAEIDVRLVQETDPERMLQRILTHIRAQGFHVLVNAEPDEATRARYPQIVRISRIESTKAYRTDMTLPESQALVRTLERAWGAPPVRHRTMGGTVPIDFFIQALGNENLRLQNFWDAVISFAAVLQT